MKPQEGRGQTATQVKVLSPVIFNVKEADSVHILEGSKSRFQYGKKLFSLSGSKSAVWSQLRIYRNLGDPVTFWIKSENLQTI